MRIENKKSVFKYLLRLGLNMNRKPKFCWIILMKTEPEVKNKNSHSNDCSAAWPVQFFCVKLLSLIIIAPE